MRFSWHTTLCLFCQGGSNSNVLYKNILNEFSIKKKVNFDLRRIKDQTSLLRSTRKVNKIVTLILRLILTARAIDVTNFPINM